MTRTTRVLGQLLLAVGAWALGVPLRMPPTSSRAAVHPRMGEPESTLQLARLQCPQGVDATLFSEVLLEYGALYVSVSDGDAGSDAEQPIYAVHPPGRVDPALTTKPEDALESWDELLAARKLWSNASLEVGFMADANVESILLLCSASAGLEQLPRFQIDALQPRDWVSEVQSNWPPVVLPGCLTIRFPWHTDDDVAAVSPAASGPAIPSLTLHPGMAFGTGEHSTTQLCCEELRRLLETGPLQGCTVLDYGSGSGVLSFAALHFGAAAAVGVEIDPEALVVSEQNARENGMEDRFSALLPEAEGARGASYPLVVANILAGTIVELAPLLASRVGAGGTILFSGIWGEEQTARVLAAPSFGCIDFAPPAVRDGWVLLKGVRR